MSRKKRKLTQIQASNYLRKYGLWRNYFKVSNQTLNDTEIMMTVLSTLPHPHEWAIRKFDFIGDMEVSIQCTADDFIHDTKTVLFKQQVRRKLA